MKRPPRTPEQVAVSNRLWLEKKGAKSFSTTVKRHFCDGNGSCAHLSDAQDEVDSLRGALEELAEAAESYIDEPPPTHLTPNPAYDKARTELWRCIDAARSALAAGREKAGKK